MRPYIIILLNFLILFQTKGQTNFRTFLESMKDTIVETHLIQIDDDRIPDTISMRFPCSYDHPEFGYSDPGVFSILEINPTKGKRIFIDEAFDTLPKQPFELYNNELSSNLVFLSDFNSRQKFMFLSGPSYGCCIEQTYIFKINENSIELLSSSSLGLVKVIDYDKDGIIELIGYDEKGETWGGYKIDYVFSRLIFPKVFRISDTLIFDEGLTYKWNVELHKKFGDFLDYITPVVVKNKTDNSEIIEEFRNIRGNYYRYYDITSRTKLKKTALEEYSKAELRIMRNEIFASHGYIFKSADLREHFSKTKWYKPLYNDVTNKLTEIEKYNITLIQEQEKK